MEAADFLKRTTLFAGFSDGEIASVLGTAKERRFPAGSVIIQEGDEGARGFYLIVDGSAQAKKAGRVLKSFGPGDYFGEMALLLGDTPRTADVIALSDVTCIVITSWDLRALITSHPELGVRIMAELARRLRDTDAALQD